MGFEDLEPDELFIFKWQYRMLGDFGKALVEAIARADTMNKIKLAQGFPNEVRGYIRYSKIDSWWEKVQKKGGKEGGK